MLSRHTAARDAAEAALFAQLPTIDLHHVIYPEEVYVTGDVILGWAADATINAAVDDYVKQNGLIPDDADGDMIWASLRKANPAPTDVEEAKAILSDLGTHTFARQ